MDTLPADPLTWLRAQVRKDGVGLGGLTWAQQRLALAWVWAGLPDGPALDERAVNTLLKDQLAAEPATGQGAACWLRTDHVELRRWLVDAGLLQRDGYGRAYRRTPADRLPAAWDDALCAAARALAVLDTSAWTAAERAAHQAERAQRLAAWQAQTGSA